jgi:acetolactate decarboxylase
VFSHEENIGRSIFDVKQNADELGAVVVRKVDEAATWSEAIQHFYAMVSDCRNEDAYRVTGRTKIFSLVLPLLLCGLLLAEQPGEVFQVSTLSALSLGIFQGSLSFSQLREHGNFGVGTFDGLDGELVVLDGRFYQIRADGSVSRVENTNTTPFAVVTNFHAERTAPIRGPAERLQVLAAIDQNLESTNYFYAVKIHGDFISLTARSVPKQVPPYPTLAEAIAKQSIFPLQNVRGTLVGFRSPAFVNGINQAGYHFHFISDDLQSGGHALDFVILDATIEIETIRKHSTFLPDNDAFRLAPLP